MGRAIDHEHPGTRGNYRMLETPPDELIVQIQRPGFPKNANRWDS